MGMALFACSEGEKKQHHEEDHADGVSGETKKSKIHYEEEVHFANITKLTDGGDNAEAYWSFDSKQLVFQVRNDAWGFECDQILRFDPFNDIILEERPTLISTGL